MSSKRRRAARAWMSAERDRHRRELDATARRVATDARADERASLTRMIPRDDENTVYPMGKLDKPRLVVAARFDLAPVALDVRDLYARAEMMRYSRVETFMLRPIQHALVLPDGAKVVWWGWEMTG